MAVPKGAIRKPYQDYLVPGETYRVKQPFLDAKKSVHRAGEMWTYLAYLPSGFGEATAIFATDGSGKDCTFAVDWNSTANNLGLENLRDYIERATQ